MLEIGDPLPDLHARLSTGDDFLLSHDAAGCPVVIVVGAAIVVEAPALVIHVGSTATPGSLEVLDDEGHLAAALVGGPSGIVVAGRDHRVVAIGPIARLDQLIASLPELSAPATVHRTVPLLTVDNVFDPSLCATLVANMAGSEVLPSPSFVVHGGDVEVSDARPIEVSMILQFDASTKMRLDHQLDEPTLLATVVDRIQRRLLPEIVRGFAHHPCSFEAPKLVRYPSGGGFFATHRDNTTDDCAHRRLAVTINLDDAYVGGELRFPEFGDELYRPLLGSAMVFSCGLLHEVVPVTDGARHALITFLW